MNQALQLGLSTSLRKVVPKKEKQICGDFKENESNK